MSGNHNKFKREAEDWILGLKHSEQYAARLGIDIKYDYHTAQKSCNCRHGFIGWCRPEGCENYFLVWKRKAALDGKELPFFVEHASRMKVPPLCAMRKLAGDDARLLAMLEACAPPAPLRRRLKED